MTVKSTRSLNQASQIPPLQKDHTSRGRTESESRCRELAANALSNYDACQTRQQPRVRRVQESEQAIQDQSLELMWKEVRKVLEDNGIQNLPTNAQEIRVWMQNNANSEHLKDFFSLNLSRLGLEVIPEEIRYFSSLTELILSHNFIKDFTILADLRELSKLDLSNNEIEDISPLARPGDFGKLEELTLFNILIENRAIEKILPTKKYTLRYGDARALGECLELFF